MMDEYIILVESSSNSFNANYDFNTKMRSSKLKIYMN
jgi:hypothetical protein